MTETMIIEQPLPDSSTGVGDVKKKQIFTGYIKYLTDEEFEQIEEYILLSRASPPVRMCLQILLYLGLRVSEAVKLRRSDFNDDFTSLTYRLAKSRPPRSHSRIVPDFLAARLRHYDHQQRWLYRDGYLFHTRTKKVSQNAHIKPATIGFFFTVMRRDLSLTDTYHNRPSDRLHRITPHTLRHSCAYRYYKAAGNDATVVQHMIGHRQLSTTLKYISRMIAKEKERDVIAKAHYREDSSS